MANIGDSRSILCNQDQAFPLSNDHKPNHRKEQKRIETAGGYITFEHRVNGNLNVSRSMGDFLFKQDKDLNAEDQYYCRKARGGSRARD